MYLIIFIRKRDNMQTGCLCMRGDTLYLFCLFAFKDWLISLQS